MNTTPDKENPEDSLNAGEARSIFSRRDWFRGGSLSALGLAMVSGFTGNLVAAVEAAPEAAGKSGGGGGHKRPSKQEPLEDFIFDIENSEGGWEGPSGTATEATVEEFPVSQSIAGVSMRLKPGGFRELHWHSIAAEWAYVLEGRVRTTVISPNGTTATDDFEVGDIWYFPKGHGHMLQCIGDKPCHFLLGFDSGHFSEFGTFSVTDWVSHTDPNIIARNLQLPLEIVNKFPKRELYIGPGPIAAHEQPANIAETIERSQTPHKFSLANARLRHFDGGTIRLVTQEDFPINSTLTSALMVLKAGAFRELHWHPNADEWQYVISGKGKVGIFGSHSRVRVEDYDKGKIAFIKQGYGHYIENTGTEDLVVLILFNSPTYQEISITEWLAANPVQLVADHFGLDPKVAAELPKHAVGIGGWQKKSPLPAQ